jgi:HTH-type transcriptional regulator, transcriptional repressor of NAD biosynthesis genes
VWHERYVGGRSSAVDRLSSGRRCAATLLTDVDIPFVQDGLRDGESIRASIHARFVSRLREVGRPFRLVSGTVAERIEAAVATIDAAVAAR